MFRLVGAVSLVLVGGAAPALAAGPTVTWGVAPTDGPLGNGRAHFAYTVAPGGSVTDAFTAVNRGDSSITLRLYASDALTTPTGGIDLLPADRKPVDVGSWLTLSRSTVTLAPQQSVSVPFTLAVPADASPGDHSGGVVSSLVTADGPSAVHLDRRLGARVYLRVPGTVTPALTVSNVRVAYRGAANPASAGDATVTYTVANTGNVRFRGHQKVTVDGLGGLLSASAPDALLPEILPGNTLSRSALVHGVWPGVHLSAAVSVQPVASLDEPAFTALATTRSATTWAWPWPQGAILLAAAGAGAGGWWLRRRTVANRQAALEAAVAQALADREKTPAA